MNAESVPQDDPAAVESCRQACLRINGEIGKAIVGQEKVIEQVLVAMLAGGHALLEGVPGLGKTLLGRSLAEAGGLSFHRIQLTPDLLPSDLTGAEIIQEDVETGRRRLQFASGPVFANVILADEFDRTPPKTRAAMLEAMYQRQVSAGGTPHRLPEPFFVLAAQNRLEQEDAPGLSQAQLDRFLLYIRLDYPSDAEEWQIARRGSGGRRERIEAVASGDQMRAVQELVQRAPVSDPVLGYAWALVRASRPGKAEAAEFVDRWVQWGAGPRGLLALVMAAKARAIVHGRLQAAIADVQAVAKPVLRHRIAGNHAAEANAVSSDALVDMLMEAVPADRKYEKPAA